MDEGFTCPAEAGGGYYSSRGNNRGGDDERGNKGDPLPLRLRVRMADLSSRVVTDAFEKSDQNSFSRKTDE